MKKLIIILAVLLLAPISLKAESWQKKFSDNMWNNRKIVGYEVLSPNNPLKTCVLTIYYGEGSFPDQKHYYGSTVEEVFEKACDLWVYEKDSLGIYDSDTANALIDTSAWNRMSRLFEDTLRAPKLRLNLDSMIENALVACTAWHSAGNVDTVIWRYPIIKVDIEQSLRNIIEVLKEIRDEK